MTGVSKLSAAAGCSGWRPWQRNPPQRSPPRPVRWAAGWAWGQGAAGPAQRCRPAHDERLDGLAAALLHLSVVGAKVYVKGSAGTRIPDLHRRDGRGGRLRLGKRLAGSICGGSGCGAASGFCLPSPSVTLWPQRTRRTASPAHRMRPGTSSSRLIVIFLRSSVRVLFSSCRPAARAALSTAGGVLLRPPRLFHARRRPHCTATASTRQG